MSAINSHLRTCKTLKVQFQQALLFKKNVRSALFGRTSKSKMLLTEDCLFQPVFEPVSGVRLRPAVESLPPAVAHSSQRTVRLAVSAANALLVVVFKDSNERLREHDFQHLQRQPRDVTAHQGTLRE